MARTFDIGSGLACDLDLLIASRLLVQASSGLGKTRTIRRLLEQTYGKVQHLVIDPEGEYYTLREKYDYVLAAPKGGDVVAHPRYAAMLAHELLKLGASAILDIYELNPDDRQRFVQIFCSALVDAPRNLWHPTLIVLDEAHVFCPEKDESASGTAVKALASRGRKRAFCLVLATQRLAKLAKDAAAELQTKLIGGCTLDVDVKRANDELGFERKDQRLRRLEPGQFFASGRAFDVREPTLVKVGPIKTSHPEPGQQAVPVPPPTAKVRKILGKLAELPAEAEAREKSLEDLRKENAALKRQMAEAKKAAPAEEKIVERSVLKDRQIQRLETLTRRLDDAFTKRHAREEKIWTTLAPEVNALRTILESLRRNAPVAAPPQMPKLKPQREWPTPEVVAPRRSFDPPNVRGNGYLPPGEKATLIAAAQTDGGISRPNLLALTGYRRSSRDAYIQRLLSKGYVQVRGRQIEATRAGIDVLGDDYQPLPTGSALRDYWLTKLPPGEREVLRVVVVAYPKAVTRDNVGQGLNYTRSSLDAFIQRLRARQLVEAERGGTLKASAALFD